MGLLLGFAPLIAFSILTNVSVDLALWSALTIAFVIAIRDFEQTRILRALDVGSTILFGLLAVYVGFIQPGMSVQAVKLVVDLGFLMIGCGSILAGSPFILDYVREMVAKDTWRDPDLRRANVNIAGAWLFAFTAMSAADAAATFSRRVPFTLDAAAGLVALTLAIIFTARYPLPQRIQAAIRPRRSRPRRRL